MSKDDPAYWGDAYEVTLAVTAPNGAKYQSFMPLSAEQVARSNFQLLAYAIEHMSRTLLPEVEQKGRELL
jgi:hypothetical protein